MWPKWLVNNGIIIMIIMVSSYLKQTTRTSWCQICTLDHYLTRCNAGHHSTLPPAPHTSSPTAPLTLLLASLSPASSTTTQLTSIAYNTTQAHANSSHVDECYMWLHVKYYMWCVHLSSEVHCYGKYPTLNKWKVSVNNMTPKSSKHTLIVSLFFSPEFTTLCVLFLFTWNMDYFLIQFKFLWVLFLQFLHLFNLSFYFEILQI